MATLLEKYTNRLTRANNEYKARTGRQLTESKKMLTAAVLENTAKFMNFRMNRMTEALDNSMGVQTSDIGTFKKFILDVTETSTPNLIAPEICLVKTMDAMTGYAVYRKFTANSRKGVRNSDGTFTGRMNLSSEAQIYDPTGRDVLRGTMANGKPQSEYTSKVVEVEGTAAATTGKIVLRWAPVVPGSIKLVAGDTTYIDNGNGKLATAPANATLEKIFVNGTAVYHFVDASGKEVAGTPVADSDVFYGAARDVSGNDANAATDADFAGYITLDDIAEADFVLVYSYNNEYVPANDIPLIGATQEAVYLHAHARRIAIYYSQLAEFEAQKDYSFSLGDELKKQAEYQLQYEVDTEVAEAVINLGNDNANGIYSGANGVTWYTVAPIGVNMRDHYETINVALATADARLFNQTQKFSGTYILVGPLGLRYFSMNSAFKMLSNNRFGYGPYVAGEVMGKKLIVTPIIQDGSIYVGVNSGDTSALIYGIYMPIVPTQFLQFADGGTSGGFSTLYDLQVLNPQLVIKIDVIEGREPTTVTVVDNG